jgi:hypothetical protein
MMPTEPQSSPFVRAENSVQTSLLKIAQGFSVAMELLLIESGGLLEYSGRVGGSSALLLEVSEAFAEGQMTGQLDKANEIATLSAAVTVEEIFAGVDIERRPGPRMQGTDSDELGAMTGGPDARAREFAEPESAKTKAQLGDRRDRRVPANEPRGRAFDGERKVPVGNGPGRPSGQRRDARPSQGVAGELLFRR